MLTRRLVLGLLLCGFVLSLPFCRTGDGSVEVPITGYWAQTDTVSYVGMAVCAGCHPNQHDTYLHTGMGRSFGLATPERSDADYSGHPEVVDSVLNLRYRPFWRGEELFIAEYRLQGRDTVHYLEQNISYVIGSGQHTNSHLINREGYVYQAPITYYTQDGRWDLAPGFSRGFNSRFSRMIEAECMTCHNGLPTLQSGSLNGYSFVAQGIDCERCHGPGAEHVRQKLAGILVDTATAIDYTIVHPGKLPIDAQLDLCQRCHLQGVAVLNDGADWFDFTPGDRISEHWNVFLPDFAGGNGSFLMASQAERLRKSACFIESEGLTCITCHNPHQSVRNTPASQFDQACLNCHSGTSGGPSNCSEEKSQRLVLEDHCSGCHMPRSGSVDIPHVTITDHNIRVPGRQDGQIQPFNGLECLTDASPSALTMARGYLRFYEAFSPRPVLLDSVALWLQRARQRGENPDLLTRTQLHLFYLSEDYRSGAAIADKRSPAEEQDAWSCYRSAECLAAIGNNTGALPWFERAAGLLPRHPPFLLKYGNALALQGDAETATEVFQRVATLDPLSAPAWYNLGFLALQKGRPQDAERHFRQSIQSDPNYLPPRIQLLQLDLAQGSSGALKQLQALLREYPDDELLQAIAARYPIR